MQLELAKELYEFEWRLRDNVTSWLQVPMTALIVLAAAIAFLYQHAAFQSGAMTTVFRGTIAAAAVLWAYATFCVARSFFGYDYEKVPNLSRLCEYFAILEAHFAAHPSSRTNAESEFDKYLVRRMAEAIDRNSLNNIRKAHWLNRSSQGAVLTLIAVAVTGIEVFVL